MTVKSSISLTDRQDAFARRMVAEGRYSSMSSVLQQALDQMQQRVEEEEADMLALKTLLEERAKGPFVSAEEFRVQLDESMSEWRKSHGLEG